MHVFRRVHLVLVAPDSSFPRVEHGHFPIRAWLLRAMTCKSVTAVDADLILVRLPKWSVPSYR